MFLQQKAANDFEHFYDNIQLWKKELIFLLNAGRDQYWQTSLTRLMVAPFRLKIWLIRLNVNLNRGCGSVGWAVASEPEDGSSNPVNGQNSYLLYTFCQLDWNDENVPLKNLVIVLEKMFLCSLPGCVYSTMYLHEMSESVDR